MPTGISTSFWPKSSLKKSMPISSNRPLQSQSVSSTTAAKSQPSASVKPARSWLFEASPGNHAAGPGGVRQRPSAAMCSSTETVVAAPMTSEARPPKLAMAWITSPAVTISRPEATAAVLRRRPGAQASRANHGESVSARISPLLLGRERIDVPSSKSTIPQGQAMPSSSPVPTIAKPWTRPTSRNPSFGERIHR